jgi:UDP-N-acetylmuramoylalanine--D-glutamate ligase
MNAGEKVLIIGLGESGLAMVRFLVQQGVSVVAYDSRTDAPQIEALRANCPKVEIALGQWRDELLNGIHSLGMSPGISPLSELGQKIWNAANQRNLPIQGELEFFAQALRQLQQARGYNPIVLAITGTNGKTTTTKLVGHLCANAGKRVAVAGNVSPAMLDVLRECLVAQTLVEDVSTLISLPEIWVLELSSFQLALSQSFAPTIATVLNLTQDHLDWHGDMVNYRAEKLKVYGSKTIQIGNRDDVLSLPDAVAMPSVKLDGMNKADQKIAIAQAKVAEESRLAAAPLVYSFGLDEPKSPGDFGIGYFGGLQWLTEALEQEEDVPRKRKSNHAPEIKLNPLMPTDALRIRGAHNHANVLAALAMTRAIGLPMSKLLHSLRSFKGEPHRCELVSVINDVEYYDDSKGTNVGATVAALRGLGKPVILIAGGEGKGQDFAPLAAAIQRYARVVILIGKDGPTIAQSLDPAQVEVLSCESLEAAVQKAGQMAQTGEVVLLSPACSSFDMFRNYGHRAEVFVASVRLLAEEAGLPC